MMRKQGEIDMTKFDFNDGNGPVPAHQHSNGGGWVADTAYVDVAAYIGPDARVTGNACVYGNAEVSDNAWVFGDARVTGNAQVTGNARVSGDVEDDDTSEDIFIEMNGKRYKLVEVA